MSRHTIINHLYTLAALGNSLAIGWTVKEIIEHGYADQLAVLFLLTLIYVVLYWFIAAIRTQRRKQAIRRKRHFGLRPHGHSGHHA